MSDVRPRRPRSKVNLWILRSRPGSLLGNPDRQRIRDHLPTCQATQQQPPSSEIQGSLCRVIQFLNPLSSLSPKANCGGAAALLWSPWPERGCLANPRGEISEDSTNYMASSLPVRGHNITSISGERPSSPCCREIDSFIFLWAVC